MTSEPPKSILIIGGGTAGWMAANIFLHAWKNQGVKVTLIESSDIGVIGVGEGSTPALRRFFSYLRIADREWMPACNATYKTGIQFKNWSTHPGFKHYFHPFYAESDMISGAAFMHNVNFRRFGWDAPAHPDPYFLSTHLAYENKSPTSIKFSASHKIDYGYHFDAGLLGKFLSQRAKNMGLTHLIDHVDSVSIDAAGNIGSINTKTSGTLTADLYVDCSGFAGLLINKALQEPFISYKENLFNDSAVTILSDIDATNIMPATVATALSSGWAWKIPLTNRFGNGYVYSSEFITSEEAEQELRKYLGSQADNKPARHLKMRVGRIANHWKNNCLAIGLAQGFIEPLEATALAIVQSSLERFVDVFDNLAIKESKVTMQKEKKSYNEYINSLFEGVRDYIVAHYVLNSRNDSEYWKACRNINISDNLSLLLDAWRNDPAFERTLKEKHGSNPYCAESWYCILAGMGLFPQSLKPLANTQSLAPVDHYIAVNKAISSEHFINHSHHLKHQAMDRN